jgi:hypothetical protein
VDLSESTDVVLADTPASIDVFRTLYDPDLDFRKLAEETTYFARGFRLVEKDWLCDVPHCIIAVTYREGYVREENGEKLTGDYVSFEAVVADAETLKLPQVRAQVDITSLAVYPNEAVIYNDGSKGCRRSITKLLNDIGMIDVGGKADPDNPEAVYDRPFSLWKSGAERAQAGIVADIHGQKFRYMVPRGLRKSVYPNPAAPKEDAETFYFA